LKGKSIQKKKKVLKNCQIRDFSTHRKVEREAQGEGKKTRRKKDVVQFEFDLEKNKVP